MGYKFRVGLTIQTLTALASTQSRLNAGKNISTHIDTCTVHHAVVEPLMCSTVKLLKGCEPQEQLGPAGVWWHFSRLFLGPSAVVKDGLSPHCWLLTD